MHIASGVLGVLLAATAVAAEDPLATRSGWEAGVNAARYRYEEPGVMWLEGERFGASLAYTGVKDKRVYGRIEARWSYGELEYQSSRTGTLNNVPDHLLETRMLAGRDYPRGSLVWSPYAGAAFRYLYNDLRGFTSTGHIGYRRESLYFYVPLGVTLRMPLGADWVLAPRVEYGGFVRGVQRSHLADTGIPGSSDVTNKQRDGRGYRAQLMVEGRRWSFGLWTDYWDVKDSDVQLGGREPANWTRETAVEIRYRF